MLLSIRDEEGTISVQGDAGKMIQEHQEADQQVETPIGARHAVVLLQHEEFLPRADQFVEQQVGHCLIRGCTKSHTDEILSYNRCFLVQSAVKMMPYYPPCALEFQA